MSIKTFNGRTRSTNWRPIPELGDWPLDHTYVTTAEGDIWRCFGGVQPKEEEFSARVVSEGKACFEWVQQISRMTAAPAVAGITHQINGICQNASNRLLLPAGIDVSDAPGNEIATTVFGKFGLGLKSFADAVKDAAYAVNQQVSGSIADETVESTVARITRSKEEELEILKEDLLDFLNINTDILPESMREQLIEIYSALYQSRHSTYADFTASKLSAQAYKTAIRRNVVDALQDVKSVVGDVVFNGIFKMPAEVAALRVAGAG